jgi:hypothetical protein
MAFYNLFWSCNVLAILLVIGFWKKWFSLLWAVLVLSLITQAPWICDQFLYLLFGASDGRTSVMYSGDSVQFSAVLAFVSHLITIPTVVWFVWKKDFFIKSVGVLLGIYIWVFLPISYIFTPKNWNINCLNFPCGLDYYRDSKLILEHRDWVTWGYALNEILFWNKIYLSLILLYLVFWLIWRKWKD